MTLDAVEALGLIAGVFGTFAATPQAIKIWRTRSAEDVSVSMFVMAITGSILWAVYGVLRNLPSIVLWNAIAFLQLSVILVLTLRFSGARNADRQRKPPADQSTV